MCILPVEGSSEGSSPMKNCLENTRFQVITLLVGSLLIGGGIALICLAQPGVPMGLIGGIAITVGTPFLTYGLFLLIYNQCVLKQQKPEPANNPKKEEEKKFSFFTIPKALKIKPKTATTMPAECRFSFPEKMKAIYTEFESAEEKKLDKRAEKLVFSDLEGKAAIKGTDQDGRQYLAIAGKDNTLRVFAQTQQDYVETKLYTITGKSVKESSPFSDQKDLDAIKEALK